MAIRIYQNGDKDQIQKLYTEVFQNERTDAEWEWKFLYHPLPSNPFILVYENNGEILGHIALWIQKAFVNGDVKKVALRVDTMVSPKVRGKGIYQKLNEKMLEEAKKRNISLLYGFPASRAKNLLLKTTNAHYVGHITRFMKIFDPVTIGISLFPFLKPLKPLGNIFQAIQRRKIKSPCSNTKWTVKRIQKCDKYFDEFAEEIRQFKPIMVKRDAAYLNWRYINHPVNDYRILALQDNVCMKGFIVVKREEMPYKLGKIIMGSIVDFVCTEDESMMYALIEASIKELSDAAIIQTWFFPDKKITTMLKKFGIKEKDQPMPLVIHPLNDEDPTGTQMNDWWITQGDVDSF